VVTITSLRTK